MNKDSKNWLRSHPFLVLIIALFVVLFVVGVINGDSTTFNGMGMVFGIFLAYFFPTVIAASKKKANVGAVFALNLLLGWTVIGWIVALVWALSNSGEKQIITVTHPTSQADELKKLAELKDSGVLSQEEFDRKKQSILGA